MFKVNFYNFSKKSNSTVRPSGDGTFLNCSIRTNSGVVTPLIEVHVSNPSSFNYCYIAEYGRYYYVSDWTYNAERGTWSANLNTDVLATYKDYIGAQDFYCYRSANKYNGYIIDGLYPTKTNFNFYSDALSNNTSTKLIIEDSTMKSGSYVLGVINAKGGLGGSVSYYQMSSSQLASFMNTVLNGTDWGTLENITTNEAKLFADPFQYIASCLYFPLTANFYGTDEAITFGYWNSGVTGKRLTQVFCNGTYTIDLRTHPQIARGQYLNCAPYTERVLYLPAVGTVELDTTLMIDPTILNVDFEVELITGQIIYRPRSFNSLGSVDHPVYFGQLGSQIQLSQVSTNYNKALAGSIYSGLSLITGDFAGAAEGLINGISATYPNVSNSSGSNGSIATTVYAPTLHTRFNLLVDEDATMAGRPLMEVIKPADVGGYMILRDGDLNAPCYQSELDALRNYLKGGFYYE